MGTWGTALYSSDYAADLRSTISALMRLPYDGNRLFEILCETENDTANNPQDEDHTIFWLVAADQFLKRGVVCNQLTARALSIIEEEQDLAMMDALDMSPSDLRKRKTTLEKLRDSLINPPNAPASSRKVLTKPQPYLMEIGDCFIYPLMKGDCVNPYITEATLKNLDKDFRERMQWKPDGYGLAIIIQRGRAFDYLTWYRPLIFPKSLIEKPGSFDKSLFESEWLLARGGTVSPSHFKRLGFEKLVNLQLDEDNARQIFPKPYRGDLLAIDDISISNCLKIKYIHPDSFFIRPKDLFHRKLAATVIRAGQGLE